MTHLSKSKTIALWLVGAVVLVIFKSPLTGQNSEGCFITIDGREEPLSVRGIPSTVSLASPNAAMFTAVGEISGLDNKSASVTLPARRTSAAIYLSDFDLQIPDDVTVLGLEVIVTGEASEPGVIIDSRISLATGPTNILGDNMANRTGSQNPWDESPRWNYGGSTNQWGTSLNSALVTQSNFGVVLQIRNTSDVEVMASIDQLAIRVHYQAALEICGHPCVSLQSLPEDDVVSYVWEVDNTLVWSPSNELDHVVNIFADQSPLGTYEICLTKTYADGNSDRCCRPLNYTSCETGSIGDRIWQDLNGNGLQDSGEPGLDNYQVFLHSASGTLLESTRSVNGQYRFDNLEGGTYYVRVDPLDRITSPHIPNNDSNNSDIENIYFFGSTAVITLEPGQNITDIDLGLTSQSGICGTIWRDRDGDGQTDASMEIIPNLTVNLFDDNNNLISTTNSDTEGRYCFDNIGAGEFQIEYVLPDGFGVSSYGPNEVDLNTGRVTVVLDNGEFSEDNNLFAFIYSSIGDEVWEDADGDGLRGAFESGIEGIQMSLMNCTGQVIRTIQTNSEGLYLFSDLPPGDYTICADGSSLGLQPTIQSQGPTSSVISANGCTSCIAILDDTAMTNIDAGFIAASGSIGDLVWLDENANGVQDLGEPGVAGVRVSLENCQGQEISFQQTDINGSYLFTGIPAGQYVLCVQDSDTERMLASNLLGSNECTSCFTHVAGVDLLTMDFATQTIQLSGDLCGSVWEDVNGNNRLDVNQDRRLSTAVNVFNCNGQLVGTIGAGDDCLEDLPQGDYYIETDIPPGFEQVTFGNGISPNGVGTSSCFTLGTQDVSIEIGIIEADDEPEFSTISVQAIEDINENGRLDGIESGISGVRVVLIDCNGFAVDEAIADNEGIAFFTDVLQGEYFIEIEVLPGTSFFSGGDITGLNGPGTTDCFELEDDQLDITAAYISQFAAQSNISGQVWLDLNGNGIFDPIESGMGQVAVRLYDVDFSILDIRFTDADGIYEFDDIAEGEYILQFVRPPLYDYTDFQVTTNPAFGSDVIDPILGMTEIIRLGQGQNVGDIDAGLVPVVTADALISGTIWQDENANSVLDLSEARFANMQVLLFEGNGTYHSATFTNDNGVYLFPQLQAGEYFVQFELPDGFVYVDSKVDGFSDLDSEVIDFATGHTLVFDIGADEMVGGVNAGLKVSDDNDAAIFGRLWIDTNPNNEIDNDEPGYRDLLVSLFDINNNLVAQTMSSEDGFYDFSQLASGDYYVQVNLTDGYEFVVAGQNAGGSQIENAAQGRTFTYRLDQGQSQSEVNIGFIPVEEQRIAIGGKVWIDANVSNTLDQGEAGFVSMDVLLYDADDNFIEISTTDNLGEYLFPSIPEGQYYIDFELPNGFDYVQPLVDGNSDIDSKVVNATDGTTALIMLALGDKLENIHAGIRRTQELPIQLSGRVWTDEVANNLIDGNESGVAQSMVLLFDEQMQYHSATFTDDEGFYSFPQIRAGGYFVSFSLPDGFEYADAKAGGNSEIDSEVVDIVNGRTELIITSPGEHTRFINAGFRSAEEEAGSISGRMWIDTNGNNLNDAFEAGQQEFIVLLFDAAGNYDSATFTDDDGRYAFPNIRPGDYIVEFDLPLNFSFVDTPSPFSNIDGSHVTDLVTGRTESFTVNSGEEVSNINAGISDNNPIDLNGVIQGRVWIDSNGNDIEDSDEEGFEGLSVFLLNGDQIFIEATLTDVEGNYIFSDLPEGNYILEFPLANGYEYISFGIGSDDSQDSDVSDLNSGRTDILELQSGETKTDIDLGLRLSQTFPSSISGRVWVDRNYNDIEDPDEEGFPRVTIFLFNEDLEELETRVAPESGHYEFNDLTPGNYIIGFSLPGGHDFVHFAPGSDSETNSDIIENNAGRTEIITLGSGEDVQDIDAGVRFLEEFLSGIGGRVWEDRNYNDNEDPNEPGFPRVTVFLFDEDLEILDTRISDAEGLYSFTDLYPDDYVIGFSLARDHDFVHYAPGTNPETNSDIIENNAGRTNLFTLNPMEQLSDIDAGVRFREEFLSGINGRVWVDVNRDDEENVDEPGFSRVTVFLFNEELEELDTRVSDANGLYAFEDVYPDDYIIGFSLPPDHDFVHFSPNSNPATNSDILIDNAGRTDIFTLAPMTIIGDIDAGVRFLDEFLSEINGRVWVDENADDIENDNELGFEGVIVTLYSETLSAISTTISDSEGFYNFSAVAPDNYFIGFSVPSGYEVVQNNIGADPSANSDVLNDGTGRTNLIIVDATTTVGDIDMGIRIEDNDDQIAWISGTTWFDFNENGQLDGGEDRVVGLEVNLLDENGDLLDTKETSATGVYWFNQLQAGNYIVEFGPVADQTFTVPNSGANSLLDSGVTDFDTGRTDVIALGALDSLMFVNAGYVEDVVTGTGRADIAGLVWEDVNGNGIIDVDEDLQRGIEVILFNGNDIQIASTITTRQGNYVFPAITSGEYYVVFFLPPDTRSTFMDVGQDEAIDSDITEEGRTELFNHVGTAISGLNAGYFTPVTIGDAIWLDVNLNGIFDIDEQGANNQIISLHAADGTFIERAFSRLGPSGQNGFYQFTNQAPGEYYIQLLTQQGVSYSDPNQGTNENVDSDVTGENGPGSTDVFFVPSGGQINDIDVGLILEPATLGDRVWIDSNGNGIQEAGEDGLNGVKVELFNIFDVQVGETVTSTIAGEDGRYLFEDVFPADYYIKFELPDEFVFSPSDMGGVDAADSDVNDSNGPGTTSIFLLSPAETDLDLDAGIFASAFVGDFVWHDRNLDGMQDANEPGVADVRVSLFRVEGNQNILVDETVTSRFGEYRFSNAANGDYFLIFEPGDDFEITTKNIGGDNSMDSDADNRGVTDVFTLSSNQSISNIDVGLIRPGNIISGLAWDDENQNGIYDIGEPFMDEVTIWLLNSSGTILDEQLSGPGGRYLFDDLDNGTFILQVILPPDYEFTAQDAGLDDRLDSDFAADGFSQEFSFTGGDVFRNVDVGAVREGRRPPVLYPNPSIGNMVQLKADVYEADLPMGCTISDSRGAVIQRIDFGMSHSVGEQIWEINASTLPNGVYTVRVQIGRRVDYIRLSIVE